MDTEKSTVNEATVRQGGVGATLREERVRQGVSLGDVSGRIKFAPKQIEALEADNYEQLPEGAFLRGFVRSYARLLQLDEKALIARLPHAPAPVSEVLTTAAVEVPFPGEQAERNAQLLKIGAAAALAVLVVGGGLWRYAHRAPEPETAPTAPVAAAPAEAPQAKPVAKPAVDEAPVPSAASATLPTPPQAATQPVLANAAAKSEKEVEADDTALAPPALRLVFKQASWVEVKDERGIVLMSKRGVAGSELTLNGKPPFSVAIARTSGVKLYFKGRPIDLAPHSVNGSARLRLE